MERVLEAKLLPPVLPEVVVDRPRVEAVLDDAVRRRLTSVVAPAGFGKSTLLAAFADRHRCAWYALTEDDTDLDTLFRGVVAALRLRVTGLAEAVRDAVPPGNVRGPDAGVEPGPRAKAHAAHLCLQLQERLASDLVLVLDDLHELAPGSAAARFVEALCRQAPHRLHLVVLSRSRLPFPTARLRARGQAAELSGAMLAFDADETRVLSERVNGSDVAADRLHELTLGWPAAVRLGAEALREQAHLPGGGTGDLTPDAVIDVLAGEVFEHAEPAVAALVRLVAPLEGFTVELCDALGADAAGETITVLERRGLLQAHGAGRHGWYSLHPLVAHWARRELAGDPDAQHATLRTATDWLLDAGYVREALRAVARAGDHDRLADLLAEHGAAIVASAGADDVLRHLERLDLENVADTERHARLVQLEGEARHATGDWDGALACFERLSRSGRSLPPAAAWRTGLIHHQRGDLDAALAVYDQALLDDGSGADRAMVVALAAAAHWLRGELDECQKLAEDAHGQAEQLGDDRALAAAHTALAMVAALTGDRRTNDAHYLRALTHAERAGDVLQLIRIHSNRGSRCLEEADYAEALQELDAAISMADLAGYALFRALALTNRGQVMVRLGRLDEALRDLGAARAVYERSGAHMLAYPLAHLGDVHAARGESSLARAAYEEAIALADASGDLQGLVPALTGLAKLLVDTDPDRARELADRAAGAGPALGHPEAILTQGWVALARGDLGEARRRADEGAEAAGAHRDRASLAESVELAARAETDADAAIHALDEAAGAWRQVGQTLDEARVLVLAGARRPDDPVVRADAQRGLSVLRAAGARRDAALADRKVDTDATTVTVQVLGAFRVEVDGTVIGPADWGSRKPRDLLKILLARRRPVRRDELLDSLWPDEDPGRSARKLSVALSTLRGLLDPERRSDQNDFVAADRDSVWLPADHWDIDLATFLDAATDGLRRFERGDPGGLDQLQRAEELFAGEAFEEDAYEEWTRPVREEVRALYVETIRVLADHALAANEHDRAVRLLLRLLERDPYDERAHRGLVHGLQAGGRHGEARRMYQTYCERMEEVGAEPAPFPAASSDGE